MTSTEAWWRDKTSMTLSGLVVGGLWSEARFCGLRNLWRREEREGRRPRKKRGERETTAEEEERDDGDGVGVGRREREKKRVGRREREKKKKNEISENFEKNRVGKLF